jgi:hypothetical protein
MEQKRPDQKQNQVGSKPQDQQNRQDASRKPDQDRSGNQQQPSTTPDEKAPGQNAPRHQGDR